MGEVFTDRDNGAQTSSIGQRLDVIWLLNR
jgi:hypothetical protein